MEGSRPWVRAEENLEELTARVVGERVFPHTLLCYTHKGSKHLNEQWFLLFLTGAKSEEVALMNGLTVNLHLLMVYYFIIK